MEKRILILASQSPRRKQLLEEAGYEFQVVPPSDGAECGACSGESPAQYVARLAEQKARDVASNLPETIEPRTIVGCDTVAECDGRILGKPQNEDHARQMLNLLRGRQHWVHSGLRVLWKPEEQSMTTTVSTQLEMKSLTDAEISEYLDTDLWVGKAGGFGLQDRTGWIRVIEGSHANVVGLPLERLEQILNDGPPAAVQEEK